MASHIEHSRLRDALRDATEAQRLLSELRHAWSLWASTRVLAQQLPLGELDSAVAILSDASADHWSAGPILASAVTTLDGLGNAELGKARKAAQDAYDAILETSDGVPRRP
jgi:hypothetical protein